jgi:hypothetical protein
MVFDGVGDELRQCIAGEAKMAGTMKGREGGTRRGNTTTSRHDESMVTQQPAGTTKGQEDGARRLARVAAIVVACIEQKPEGWGAGEEN